MASDKLNIPGADDVAPSPGLPGTEALFLLLAGVSAALPTGSVLGINVKAILLLLITVALALELRGRPWTEPGRRVAVVLVVAVFFLALEATFALSRGNEVPLVLGQFRELLTTAVLVAGGIFLFARWGDGFPRFAQAMFLGASAYSIAKLAALALILSGQRSFAEISDGAQAVFGQQVMGLEFEGSLPRFHMGQDLGMPFILYLGLAAPSPGPWTRWNRFLAPVIALGVVASLSRYLWFALAVVGLVAWWRTLLRHPAIAVGALATVLVAMAWVVAGTEMGQSTVTARFQSDASTGGDDVRDEQRELLIAEFLRRPLVGKGMGSYVASLIRSDDAPYSYENQWTALLMQFGLLGSAVILLFPAWLMRGLLRRGPGPTGWSAAVVFAVFLGQGFFNPTLTSSASAMVFLGFALLAAQVPPVPLSLHPGSPNG
ncbi:MAG: hypothetical protein WB493_05715 [Anaeromyxobacteraceae bacterium]